MSMALSKKKEKLRRAQLSTHSPTCLSKRFIPSTHEIPYLSVIIGNSCRPCTTTKLTTFTIFFHIWVVTTSKLTIFFHIRVVTISKLTIFFHIRVVTTSKLTIFFHPRVVTTFKLTIFFHPRVVTISKLTIFFIL